MVILAYGARRKLAGYAGMRRATMNKIICPDCGEELDTVSIERFETKTFKLDYTKKRAEPADSNEWQFDDFAHHCPYCDSLNVDDLFEGWQVELG